MATWFSYDPNNGFEEHATREEAQSAANECIPTYLDECWDEEVERVCWGLVVGQAQRDVIATASDDSDAGQRCRDNGWDEEWEYPVVDDPDAVALLAGTAAIEQARREGAEAMRDACAENLRKASRDLDDDGGYLEAVVTYRAAADRVENVSLPPGPPTTLETVTRERDALRAKVERLRPVVEAARDTSRNVSGALDRLAAAVEALDASTP